MGAQVPVSGGGSRASGFPRGITCMFVGHGAELGRQGSHSASRACLGWQMGPTKTHYYIAGIYIYTRPRNVANSCKAAARFQATSTSLGFLPNLKHLSTGGSFAQALYANDSLDPTLRRNIESQYRNHPSLMEVLKQTPHD
jgi:hypothetical protein